MNIKALAKHWCHQVVCVENISKLLSSWSKSQSRRQQNCNYHGTRSHALLQHPRPPATFRFRDAGGRESYTLGYIHNNLIDEICVGSCPIKGLLLTAALPEYSYEDL
jgi:hypothetical protein